MHIGLIIYGSLETRSGGYLYDRQLVAYLRDHGDEVTLYPLPWRNYPRHLLQNFQRRFLHALSQDNLDLLLQDELNHPSLFLLNARLKARVSYPILALVHHLRSDEAQAAAFRPVVRAVERRYLRSVDGFICNSRATLASVRALAGVQRPAIVAHPGRTPGAPPITDAAIRARARESGPLRLLFVGNLIPRKGLHTLLQALAQMPEHMARLTIVGDPEMDPRYSQRMQRMARRLGVHTRLTWAGPVPDPTLRRLYAHHHVLVVPSQHEGFGIVYLEAMGYGVIPIGTEAGGAGEIIRPGETGLLIPVGDAQALAARLLWLHHHRAEMAEMGVAARRAWLAHPTWQETGERVQAFLHLNARADFRPMLCK